MATIGDYKNVPKEGFNQYMLINTGHASIQRLKKFLFNFKNYKKNSLALYKYFITHSYANKDRTCAVTNCCAKLCIG